MTFKRFCSSFCLLLLCMILSGCFAGNNLLTTEGITGSGWAQPFEPYDPEPLYCYRTLGVVDCYDRPVPALRQSLVGFYPRKTPVRPDSSLQSSKICSCAESTTKSVCAAHPNPHHRSSALPSSSLPSKAPRHSEMSTFLKSFVME